MTEVFNSLGQFLERYGFPLTALVAIIFVIVKYIIPAIIKQYEKQQEFLYAEVQRLNAEAKDRNDKMLSAFQQNTTAFNELRATLDEVRKDLNHVKADVNEVREDVREVYTIVGEKRNLFIPRKKEDDSR